MTQKVLAIGMLVVGCVVLAGGSAFAQRAADAKIRGDAYYFYSGEIYRTHAADHAFLLNEYSTTGEPVPKEIVKEHAAAVRTNAAASQKAYTKLSAAAKKDPTVMANLKEIDKHHAAMLMECDKLDAEAGKNQGQSDKVCAACEEIMKHVDAADELHQNLAKQLKIPPLEPPMP
jgi:hypothetical protein